MQIPVSRPCTKQAQERLPAPIRPTQRKSKNGTHGHSIHIISSILRRSNSRALQFLSTKLPISGHDACEKQQREYGPSGNLADDRHRLVFWYSFLRHCLLCHGCLLLLGWFYIMAEWQIYNVNYWELTYKLVNVNNIKCGQSLSRKINPHLRG